MSAMSSVMTRRGFLGFAVAAAAVAGGGRVSSAHEGEDQGTPEAGATPHARAGAGSGTGAAFFTVTNNGAEDDRLVSATSDVAAAVEVHEMKMVSGTMEMSPLIDGLPVPAREAVALEPGGYHIMLIGLMRDLKAGEQFEITLTFERAGEATLELPIFVSESAAKDAELPSVMVGDVMIEKIWARHAPALLGDEATPVAGATPSH
jgi:copper(I)-binding protein